MILSDFDPELTAYFASSSPENRLEKIDSRIPPEKAEAWVDLKQTAGKFEKLVVTMQQAGIVISDGMILTVPTAEGHRTYSIATQRFTWHDSWPGFQWRLDLLPQEMVDLPGLTPLDSDA